VGLLVIEIIINCELVSHVCFATSPMLHSVAFFDSFGDFGCWVSKRNIGLGPGLSSWFRARSEIGFQNKARLLLHAGNNSKTECWENLRHTGFHSLVSEESVLANDPTSSRQKIS